MRSLGRRARRVSGALGAARLPQTLSRAKIARRADRSRLEAARRRGRPPAGRARGAGRIGRRANSVRPQALLVAAGLAARAAARDDVASSVVENPLLREVLSLNNANLYLGITGGFVTGKIVKRIALGLVPAAGAAYLAIHAPELLSLAGYDKAAEFVAKKKDDLLKREEEFEAMAKEKMGEYAPNRAADVSDGAPLCAVAVGRRRRGTAAAPRRCRRRGRRRSLSDGVAAGPPKAARRTAFA